MYVLTELGYVSICQLKRKEKSESSAKNKNGLVEGL